MKKSNSSALALLQRPTQEEIAERAYLIWERDGYPHGQDVQNWVRAEQELTLERQFGSIEGSSKTQRKPAASKGRTRQLQAA